jgi:glycerol uptake facilitator-like aquaporin
MHAQGQMPVPFAAAAECNIVSTCTLLSTAVQCVPTTAALLLLCRSAVYTAANISGGHLNPAVTFSTLACGFYPVSNAATLASMLLVDRNTAYWAQDLRMEIGCVG